MAAPQQAPLPPFFDLGDGMLVRITAVDATTGAVVPDVIVSNVSLAVDPAGDAESLPSPSPVSGAYVMGNVAV